MANSQFWWPSPIETYSFMVLEPSCPKSRGQGLGKDPSLLLLELPVMASGPKHSLPSRCRTVLSAFVFLWPFSLCVSQSVCFLFFKDNTHWNRAHLTCDVVVQSLKICLTLQPHKLQHTRLPCPLLSPGICSDSCQWCHPTISSSVAPFSSFPQSFPAWRVFSNELEPPIRWPKYWSFSISPSKDCSGLISFRIDWFELLVVQGTLKNLLQHHNSKASILQCSAFFMVQLLHLYVTTGKGIVLTIQTFVGKVMSLLFNTLPRFVIDKEQASFNFVSACTKIPYSLKESRCSA